MLLERSRSYPRCHASGTLRNSSALPGRWPCTPTRSRYGASLALKPRRSQVNHQSRRLVLRGVCFFREKVPAAQIRAVVGPQEMICYSQRSLAPELRACLRLRDFMFVPSHTPGRADLHPEFLFLLRPEEARFPEPHADLLRHQPVGLGQPQFALKIGFGVVIHAEDDA